MNLSSYGRDTGTLYKQEFGDSCGSPTEGCPGGMGAGGSRGWKLDMFHGDEMFHMERFPEAEFEELCAES